MLLRRIEDEKLAQNAYLIGCQRTGEAILVDPLRDVDRYIELAERNEVRIVAVAETHIHADFVSGARELAERGVRVYVSDEGDADWKYQWLGKSLGGGSYEHRLLRDGDTFMIGNIELRALHTPGHTPEHLCFLVTDRGGGADEPMGLLSGDFLFVGDLGRPDLLETAAGYADVMEPSARRLFASLRVLKELPEHVQVWPAHGAGSACGKSLGAVPTSTVGYELRFNPAIRAGLGEGGSEDAFVEFILSGQPEPPLYFANMKRVNKEGPAVLGGVPSPTRLMVDELRRTDGRRTAIVDTRDWEAFRHGHVPGALSLPLLSSFPTDAGSLILEDEDLVIVTRPDRLDEATRELIRVGLDRIIGWFDADEMDQYEDEAHPLATIDEVDAEEAHELVSAGRVRVLDVRRETEHAEGHIEGSVNISHTRLRSRLDEAPEKDERTLVHCRLGFRSSRACSLLAREGHDVVNLAGGFVAWEERESAGSTA